MKSGRIRPLVLGLVWRGDELLVFEGYDRIKEEIYYRPLGGGIEFGEHSREALRREFREELGAELASARYTATIENIFVCNGRRGHEIILLYEATLADQSLYERETFEVREETETLTARWMPLREFQEGGPPLYPDGLLELLQART
ncbi:MAG: NUDIX hydrolase [Chloroflexi bacterium]|nr:MAG: NUDIX hydrolase [Chloroflexota bacterium]RLC81815.1 MAG: NUDIX hydrolase [Chloroflexota bacterium]